MTKLIMLIDKIPTCIAQVGIFLLDYCCYSKFIYTFVSALVSKGSAPK